MIPFRQALPLATFGVLPVDVNESVVGFESNRPTRRPVRRLPFLYPIAEQCPVTRSEFGPRSPHGEYPANISIVERLEVRVGRADLKPFGVSVPYGQWR